MKKNIHILLAATLLFGATSCEDFLQKDPPSSPSQSVFWQKKSDFESALAGTYSVMYSGVFSQIMPCLDGLTDNAKVRMVGPRRLPREILLPIKVGSLPIFTAIAIKALPVYIS